MARKRKILKIISIILLALLILIPTVLYFGLRYEVKLHNGSMIEVIDPSPFVDKYDHIGIKNVHILDADSASFSPKNIVLKAGKIISIDTLGMLQSNVTYIDGTNKFLIPGLIDTHVHLLDSKNDLYLYLANGVTSVCEMFGNEKHLQWKNEASNGAISPKLYVSTSKVASQEGIQAKLEKYFGGGLHYTSEEDARNAVKQFKKDGYDAVKLSSNLNRSIYDAILDEAKKEDIPVIGHLSHKVGLNALLQSGQAELAHVEEITKITMYDFGGLGYDNTEAYLVYLTKRADSIAIALREKDIYVSTTIWLMESLPKQKFELDSFIKTIPLKYANPGVVEGSNMKKGWLPGNNHYENLEIKNDPERRKKSKLYWETYIKAIHIMTEALARNHVKIIAGTDANVTATVAGFSLHDELNSLSNTQLSNAEVLDAATKIAADFMNQETGKIKVGYAADLVLLSKNPLEDISNTRTIEHVFFGNHKMNAAQIQELLKAIENNNAKHRNVEIEQYVN